MAANLEYIYTLRDRYSKKLASITKKQLAFTEAYRKSMGKVNSASVHHGKIIAKNTQLYNVNKQALFRVNNHLNTLTQSQSRYAKASSRRINKLNQDWRRHGKVIQAQQKKQTPGLAGMAGGVGAGLAVRNIFGTALEFEASMNRIEAVSAGKGVDMAIMRKKAIEWGISTQFSALQVAGAMAEATQAGMNMNETLAVMPGNIALAASGQMTLVEAMKLSTDVVNQYGKSLSNMAVADILAASSRTAESNVTELGAALKNTGTSAHQAGLGVKETMLAVMALGATGARGEIGGTFLMNFLTMTKKMTKPRLKAFQDFLKGSGKSMADIYNVKTGQFKDFTGFLELLGKADKIKLHGITSAFGIRGMKAIQSMAALKPETLKKYLAALDDTNGAALNMQLILMKGLPGGVKLFDSAMETSKLVMISSFIEPLSKVMRKFAKFLVYLAENHSWVLKLTFVLISLAAILTAVGIAAWVAVGSMSSLNTVFILFTTLALRATMASKLWAIGQVIASLATGKFVIAMQMLNLAFAMNPITWIILGIAALAAALAYATIKTGSFTNALLFMGGIIIKSVLSPINVLIAGIRILLYAASKIPGAVGAGFKVAHSDLAGFQDKWNLLLTGNKSITTFGMVYDLSKKGDKSSTWMEQQSKESANARTEFVTKPIEIGGNIKVSAEEGSKVEESGFFANTGKNLIALGGAF